MTTSQPTTSELDVHRPALLGHCYRMLGHPQDAADAVQDTFVRALRGIGSFEGRSSVRTWLLRIATNVCLDELKRRGRRRERPTGEPPGAPHDEIVFRPEAHWIAPLPDAWVVSSDGASTPFELLAARQSIRLAFVAALQLLPPRQRAALLLADVIGWSAAEVADALVWSVPAVNSALQRARAALGDALPPSSEAAPSLDDAEADVVQRYVEAFERFDIDALVSLLSADVAFSMPPISLWVQGRAAVATFLREVGFQCEGSVLRRVGASGLPAFAQYRDAGKTPWGLVVLELRGGEVCGITTFLSVRELFPLFGLPLSVSSRRSSDEFSPRPQSR